MTPLLVFAATMLMIGAAVAIPVSTQRSGAIRDADTPVLGASIVALGLGGMNFVFAVVFFFMGDVGGSTVLFAIAPLVAGGLGLRLVLRRTTGGARTLPLLVAAVLTLAGIPGYFALLVALMASGVTAALFLGGLIGRPRQLLRFLDPRL
jgi:hypothetical protein